MDTTVPFAGDKKFPLVGFGTYLLSSEQCEDAVLCALRAGYVHIDTAEFYDNHKGIAKAIKASGIPRDSIFITDKVSPMGFPGGEIPARTFEEILETLKQRLAMLETDFVDLYLLHHAFPRKERVNQWRALVEAQRLGLTKNIGVSNWSKEHIEEIKRSDPSLPLPSVNQIEIHPLCTQAPLIECV